MSAEALEARLARACAAALALDADPAAAERADPGDVALLLAAAVRLYGARADAGWRDPPLPRDPAGAPAPTATDVALTVSALLRASQIELFELGMWQTWSGGEGRAGPSASSPGGRP
jgi:hypothetical protein